MGQRLVEGKKDADKDRAELITELNALCNFNSRLKEVVKRYERVAGKKELYSSLYDLESEKESIESLRNELQGKQLEVDIQGEELGVQNEELRVQLDEINARTEEILEAWKSEALRESEASLARSQSIAHLGNWELDVSTNMVRGSDELYRMFNLGPDVALDAYIERMHPDDRPGVVESIKAAIYEGKPYCIDYRIVPRPGEIHYVHAEGETTRDSDGRPLTFFGTVQDITERKQAEEALRVSEERYHGLFDRMQENFSLMEVITDLQGRPIDYTFPRCEPRSRKIFRINSREKLIGRKHSDIMAAGGGAAEQKWFDIICRVGLTGKEESGEHFAVSTGHWAHYHAFSPRRGQCCSYINGYHRAQAGRGSSTGKRGAVPGLGG